MWQSKGYLNAIKYFRSGLHNIVSYTICEGYNTRYIGSVKYPYWARLVESQNGLFTDKFQICVHFTPQKKKEFEQFVKEDIQVLKRVANTKYILVCPQTFSHTVMCKVCLTASNTLFDANVFVRLNHWVRFLVVSPH